MADKGNRGAITIGVILILVLAIAAFARYGLGTGSGASENMAPSFSGVTLDGADVSLSQYRGKPLLLVFMASWCGPCLAEAPEVEKFYRDEAGQVGVLALAVWDSSESDLRQFMSDSGFTYPVMFAADSVADAFGVRSVPALILIDSAGRIGKTLVGAGRTASQLSALVDELTP